MKKRMILFDSDTVYAARFLEYINHKKDFDYDLIVFTKQEKLDAYLLSNGIEILLLGPQETFDEALEDKVKHCYHFVENREDGIAGGQSIYKYQSVEHIIDQILRDYLQRKEELWQENSQKPMVIYTVFSPVPSPWDSLFAWSMSFQLSGQRKVLFVPLELLPVTELTFLEYNREGLTEFIYYLKGNSDFMHKLRELLNYGGNLSYLSGAVHGFDMQALNKEEIHRWVEGLRKEAEYRTVIFYLGCHHEVCAELMRLSDQNHILCGAGIYENGCLNEWRRQMDCIGIDSRQDKFRYISKVPVNEGADSEQLLQYNSLQELKGTPAWQQAGEQLKLGAGGGI